MAKKTRTRRKPAKEGKRPKASVKKRLKKRPSVPAPPPAPPIRLPTGPRLKKTPLTKAELKEFRQMLLDKRRALLGDMTHMEAEALRTNRQEGTGDLSKIPTHDADVGTDNFEQEFTLGLLESERVLLREINEALERIDKRTFGICSGTGLAIGKARLKARPWAKYCIEYARMIEKGLVRRGQEQSEEDYGPGAEAADEDETDDDTEASDNGASED